MIESTATMSEQTKSELLRQVPQLKPENRSFG